MMPKKLIKDLPGLLFDPVEPLYNCTAVSKVDGAVEKKKQFQYYKLSLVVINQHLKDKTR